LKSDLDKRRGYSADLGESFLVSAKMESCNPVASIPEKFDQLQRVILNTAAYLLGLLASRT
jgi:hypothetical protein